MANLKVHQRGKQPEAFWALMPWQQDLKAFSQLHGLPATLNMLYPIDVLKESEACSHQIEGFQACSHLSATKNPGLSLLSMLAVLSNQSSSARHSQSFQHQRLRRTFQSPTRTVGSICTTHSKHAAHGSASPHQSLQVTTKCDKQPYTLLPYLYTFGSSAQAQWLSSTMVFDPLPSPEESHHWLLDHALQ